MKVYIVVDNRTGMHPVVGVFATPKGAKERLAQAKVDEPKAKRGSFSIESYPVRDDDYDFGSESIKELLRF